MVPTPNNPCAEHIRQAICVGCETGVSSFEYRMVLNRCIGRLLSDSQTGSNIHYIFQANWALQIAPCNNLLQVYKEEIRVF